MGAGNEFVSFQVAFPGNQTGISVATGRALTGPGGTIPNFIAWTLPLINATAPTQLAKLTTVAVNASWKEMAQQKGFTDRAVSYLSGACDDVSRENKNHKWEGCVDAVKDFRRQWTGIPNVMTTNIDSVNLHDPNFDVTDVLAPV